MNQHYSILTLFIALSILIIIVFYAVYRSSCNKAADAGGMTAPNRKRFLFFFSLAVVVVVLLSVTLPKSPYFLFADVIPSKVVYVAARQFSFDMSYQAAETKETVVNEAIELPVNEPVEFRVTSFDVNHGVAIYNEKAELIAQTQAIPGYVNKLRWKFDKQGTYNILCLEFCGVSHAFMRTSFKIK